MGENSKISWTHHTFNPWWGCQRVSPGCENCYAEALDKRVGGAVVDGVKRLRWGPKAPRVRTSAANWKEPLKWNRKAAAEGVRKRVFCASMADVFEDRAELVPWRADLFAMIEATPALDWLMLTKRPENISRLMPAFGWPVSNVWLGTTVEDQRRADERIPELLKVPAAVRFLSCEPLIDSVDLTRWLRFERHGDGRGMGGGWPIGPAIDWVIIGGESGGRARSFHTDWAHDLVEQCRAAGVAPFVKQLGTNPVASGRDQLALLNMRDHHGGDPAEWPEDLRVREFPEVRRG